MAEVKPGERLKWRSLTNRSRWFHGVVYAVNGKYALMEDPNKVMYPQFVEVSRLLQAGAFEAP